MSTFHGAALAALFVLSGCGSLQEVRVPDLSSSIEDESAVRIYVARRGDTRSTALDIGVWDGPKKIGDLNSGDFFCWERGPGSVVVKAADIAYSEHTGRVMETDPVAVAFQARAGESYTFRLRCVAPDEVVRPDDLTLSARSPVAELTEPQHGFWSSLDRVWLLERVAGEAADDLVDACDKPRDGSED